MEQQILLAKNENSLFSVHLGTYEGGIIGLEGNIKKLDSIYAFSGSTGSIRTMHCVGRFLLVGGFQEIVKVYDVRRRKNVSLLQGHGGTITAIKSFENIVFTSSEDGQIFVWNKQEWGLMHRFKEHKAPIIDMVLHQSGQILITISKDKKMYIWDLVKAKRVYEKKIPPNINRILLWQSDKYLCLVDDNSITLMESETNQEIGKINTQQKITDTLIYKEFLITGHQDGMLNIWDISVNGTEFKSFSISFKCHEKRVKQIATEELDAMSLLVTISTDGIVKLWDVLFILNQIEAVTQNRDLEASVKPIYEINTHQRLTSVVIYVFKDQDKTDFSLIQRKGLIGGTRISTLDEQDPDLPEFKNPGDLQEGEKAVSQSTKQNAANKQQQKVGFANNNNNNNNQQQSNEGQNKNTKNFLQNKKKVGFKNQNEQKPEAFNQNVNQQKKSEDWQKGILKNKNKPIANKEGGVKQKKVFKLGKKIKKDQQNFKKFNQGD